MTKRDHEEYSVTTAFPRFEDEPDPAAIEAVLRALLRQAETRNLDPVEASLFKLLDRPNHWLVDLAHLPSYGELHRDLYHENEVVFIPNSVRSAKTCMANELTSKWWERLASRRPDSDELASVTPIRPELPEAAPEREPLSLKSAETAMNLCGGLVKPGIIDSFGKFLTFAVTMVLSLGIAATMVVTGVMAMGAVLPKEATSGAGIAGTALVSLLVGTFGRGVFDRLRGSTKNTNTNSPDPAQTPEQPA